MLFSPIEKENAVERFIRRDQVITRIECSENSITSTPVTLGRQLLARFYEKHITAEPSVTGVNVM